MKKLICFLISTLIFTGLYGCEKNEAAIILDNGDNSSFVDFYTEDDKVYIECVLNIYSEKDCEALITAIDNEDVDIGLIKSPMLTGIDKTDFDEIFSLKRGENTVTVLFYGDYAGVYQIASREIPRFIKITKK